MFEQRVLPRNAGSATGDEPNTSPPPPTRHLHPTSSHHRHVQIDPASCLYRTFAPIEHQTAPEEYRRPHTALSTPTMAASHRISSYTNRSSSPGRPDSRDENKNIWSSMLDGVSSGKRLPEKSLLVLGTVHAQSLCS